MSFEAVIKYPSVLLVGALVALLIARWWGLRAMRWGFMDVPGGRKIHETPIPLAGGISIFLAFHAVCAVVFLYPWQPFAGQIPIEWWYRFIPLSLAVVVLGLCDDRMALKPAIKFGGQVLIAVAAYALEIRVQNILGMDLHPLVDFAATVLWFMVLMNSFNLIDGVDGLATGIALIASLGIAISLVFRSEPGDVLLFIGFAGACAGFLRYNFFPARIFLGETGSLFLGFTIAALSISTSSKGPALASIGMPLLAVGVPLFDTMLAIWRRSARSVFTGAASSRTFGVEQADAEHLHHRMLRGGRKHSQVALILYGVTAGLAALGIIVSLVNDRAIGILALAFLIGCYTVLRHLAWIELRESGEAVLRGISKPVRRNQTLLLYVLTDLAVLSVAMLVVGYMLAAANGHAWDMKRAWLAHAPRDVALPFLFLALTRSYSRVWYLARISEYMLTGLAVVLGYVVAWSLQIIGTGSLNAWDWGMRYWLMAGISAPMIIGSRSLLRVVQDVLQWVARHVPRDKAHTRRALVCGAGYRTTLFLRQMAFSSPDSRPLHITGLLDADEAKRGHYVHGIKVTGRLSELQQCLLDHKPDVIYVVEKMTAEQLTCIYDAAQEHHVPVVMWQVVEEPLSPDAIANMRRADSSEG